VHIRDAEAAIGVFVVAVHVVLAIVGAVNITQWVSGVIGGLFVFGFVSLHAPAYLCCAVLTTRLAPVLPEWSQVPSGGIFRRTVLCAWATDRRSVVILLMQAQPLT
jgi:hypothetical protein